MRAVVVALLVSASMGVGCGFDAPGESNDDDGGPRVDARLLDAPRADGGADSGSAGWLVGYTRRRLVTMMAAAADGMPVTVLVALEDDDDFDHESSGDPRDVAFALPDGTPLAWEIEASDDHGNLDAWVGLPRLAAGLQFYLYYGALADGALPPPDPTTVWSVDRYQAVWHFTDVDAPMAIASTAPQIPMFKPADRSTPPRGTAKIGEGRSFTTQSTFQTGVDLIAVDHAMESFSYSILVNADDQPYGLYDTPLWKNGAVRGQPGFDIELGMLSWGACIADADGSHAEICPAFSAAPLPGVWHYLTVVVARQDKQIRTYLDGTLAQTLAIPDSFGSVHNTLPLTVGRPNFAFRGMLDEVRLDSRALSAAEVAFEAKNLLSPTTTAIVGPVETQ